VVEYTIACDAEIPTEFPGIDSIEPSFDPDVTINGVLEVLDTPMAGPIPSPDGFGPELDEAYIWQGFMDIPLNAQCTVQLRARDFSREVICTSTVPFDTNPPFADGNTVKVNVLMYCGISFQAPVASLDVDGDFSFNISNFCPDLFVLNCIDYDLDIRDIPGAGTVAATACQVRARDGDSQCGDSCDPQTCVPDAEGLTCAAAPEPMFCDGGNNPGAPCATDRCTGGDDPGAACRDDIQCQGTSPTADGTCDPITTPECQGSSPTPDGTCSGGPTTTVACLPPSFRCAAPPLFGVAFGTPCNPVAADFGNSDCGWPPPGTDLGGGNVAPAVCAPGAVMDCNGIPNDPSNEPPFDTHCTYNGDVLGEIGGLAPAPLNPGPGGFFIQCVLADDDGDPTTPDVPVDPGAIVDCQATTTDGDEDCSKVKTLQVKCPGLTQCQTFGGDTACQATSTTECQVGTCNDATCDGADPTLCCDFADAPNGADCTDAAPPASCMAGVCVSQDCNAQTDPDGSCDDFNECTINTCNAPPSTSCNTENVPASPPTACAGTTGVCDGAGNCQDNCDGVVCDLGNPCLDYGVCDPSGGAGTCPTPVPDDTGICTSCGTPPCICDAGSCIAGCTVPPVQDVTGIPMACRNSFQVKAVSEFPIDLTNISTGGDCIEAGQAVNFDMDPVIALDTAFLQAAANTLCGLGTPLTEAVIELAQVAVDAIAGATCTEQLSELTPVPQTITIDATVTGTCGAGGSVTINSGVSVPLPALTLPCTAGAAGTDALLICSVGETPIQANIDLATTPVQTFVGVSVGGGNINIVFQCGTSSTTNPEPGVENQIGCAAPNPAGPCDDTVGMGNTGEELAGGGYPVSNCDFLTPPATAQDCGGFDCPGTCTAVPIAVDPSTVCASFTVQ